MADVQNTTNTTETTVIEPMTTQDPSIILENMSKEDTIISTGTPTTESKPQDITADDQLKDDAVVAEDKEESAPVIEPISQGQLTYKGPGLLK